VRILFLSNFYPPVVFGGYEIRCREVAEGMRARGHDCRVATSCHGQAEKSVDGPVHRILTSFWDLPNSPGSREEYIRAVADDTARFKALVSEFAPDVISFWNMLGLAYAVPTFAMHVGVPVLLHIEDDWLLQADRSLIKFGPVDRDAVDRELGADSHLFPLGSPAKQPFSATFGSRYRYDRHAGLGPCATDGTVIHGGVDTDAFDGRVHERFDSVPPARFLFVGAHTEAKGPHLAVEALAQLPDRASLTLVGFTTPSPYLDALQALPARLGVADRVTFLGPVPQDRLMEAYAAHDALVFTSTAPEGFPITIQEAMAMGMAVVTSLTGGHAEYIEDGVNSLVFETGDSGSLARAMARVMDDPGRAARLAATGRRLVRDRFSLPVMFDRQEACLRMAAAKRVPGRWAKISGEAYCSSAEWSMKNTGVRTGRVKKGER